MVVRQKWPHSMRDESWVSVCLYDNEHHYRGPAVFDKLANAKNYDIIDLI